MRRRSPLAPALVVVLGLIAGLLVAVGATAVEQPDTALAIPAPTSPLPECVVDDDGRLGRGCVNGEMKPIVSGTYAQGGSFTIDAGQLGLSACPTYVSTGCYYDVFAPSLVLCVYLHDNDPKDVRSCSGSLSTSGTVSAVRQGSCRGSLGSVYANGGPGDSAWTIRGPRTAACEYVVEGTGEIDNLRGPTFYLVRASVDECIEPGGGFGCDESWATLERHTGYAWLPVEGDLAPRASFKAEPTGVPGQYTFRNTSVPFDGGATYEWSFGDGSPTSSTTSPTHTFTEPGWRQVRLTMSDPTSEQTRTATEWLEIEALALDVTVVNPEARFGPGETGNRHEIGDEFPVVVRLAANNGVGTLTDLAARDAELFAGLPPQLEVVETDDLDGVPSDVSAGDVFTIRATVKAVKAGRFTLRSTWDAIYNGTDPVDFFGAHEGGVSGLSVEVVVDPAKVEQDEANDDEPVPVAIEVRIENTSEDDITALTLRSLGIERRMAGQAVDYDWVDPEIDPPADGLIVELLPGVDPKVTPIDPISGFSLPDIPKGQTVVVHAKVIVNDDGVFDVKAQAQAASPTGGTLVGTGETKLEVDPEYYLKFETEVLRPLPGTLVPAGETIRIKGSIENVTTTATIEIGTPFPTTSGNAGEMVATWNPTSDTSSFPAEPLDTVVLQPGERIEFLVRILTGASDPRPGRAANPSGGTRANIEFTPWGIATLEDGSELDVVDDLIDAVDEQLEFTVSIDDSIELPERDDAALAAAIFLGGMEGAVNSVVALVEGIIQTPEMIYSALRAVAEYQTKVWNSFSEAEKADFQDSSAQLIASVLYRNFEFARRDGPELYNQAYEAVGTMMTDLATEWETGDYLSTAQAYSAAGSEAVGSIVLPIAMTKLVRSPQAVAALERWQAGKQGQLAAVQGEIAAIEKVQDAGRLLRVIEAGLELAPDQIAKLFGIGVDDAAELLRFAEKYNLLITVRSRHATSLQWIERFGAMFKPEALKVKSVSDLDVELGYPADRLGSLVFKKPEVLVLHGGAPTEVQISQFVVSKGFTPNTPEYWNAMKRVVDRMDEWKKYEQTYKQWSRRGWIETTFDFEGNNAAIANLSKDKKFNGFRMQRLSPEGDPNELYALQLFDAKKGKWVPITGDIDPIAFTKLDGSPISSATHKALLEEMIKSPQLRAIHGETATFTKTIRDANGNVIKRLGGLDLIESQFKPGEAAIQFAPGANPRTVRFNKDKSRWDSAFDYDLHWDGGFVEASKPKLTQAQSSDLGISLINGRPPVQAPPVKDIGIPKPPAGGSGPNYGRCRIDSGGTPNGAVISGADGSLVGVGTDGSTSVLADLKVQCFSEGTDVIPVATGVVTTVEAASGGSGSLGVDSLVSVPGADALVAGSSAVVVSDATGLVVGDIAVLSPGAPSSEIVQITAISGLRLELAEPTRFTHPDGTLFAVVDRAVVSGPVKPVSPARVADTRSGQVTVDGQVQAVGAVAGGTALRIPVRGRAGVPASATAVVVNTVAVRPSAPGFLALYPCDQPVPSTSTVNYGQRPVDVNGSLVKLSSDGAICVFAKSTTDVVVDVTAYAEGSEALSPKRLAESRTGGQETTDGQSEGFGRVAAGSVTEVQVAGRGGVPIGAAAVAVNVTVVRPDGPGFLTLYPCDEERPNASNLNHGAGDVRPNSAVVALSAAGTLCVFSLAATDLIVDVTASFGSVPSFAALNPARLLETRSGRDTIDGVSEATGRLAAGSTTTVQVAGRGGVPADAAVAAVNVAAIRPGAPGFVTFFPCDEDRPNASSMNYVAGDVIANSGIVKLAADGSVCIFTKEATDLVVDVNAAWTAA